jgi:hypothetical protein
MTRRPIPRTARPLVRLVAASSIVVVSVLGAVSAQAAVHPASCSATTLSAWKAVVGQRIHRRVTTLDDLSAKLGEATRMTSAHRATLSSTYSTDTSGLNQLDSKLQAEATCDAVRADAQAVVQDYYVFALVVPQSGLTAAADAGRYGAGRLATAEPAIKKAIALLPDGSTKTAAQASYDDLVAQVTTATSDFSGVGDAVLALTPASFPTRTGVLKAQAARTAAGGQALAKALQDARALQGDLAG